MSTLFISDLHLSVERPDITAAFVEFMTDTASQADALYVLGDLFDAWFGDDFEDECINQVKQAFLTLTQSGVPVYFIHGNRDFLLGKRFAKQSGVTLLPEQCVVELYGKPVVLLHGDTLCTQDHDYQKFRRKSRTWWWQGFMLSLPLRLRKKIADDYRAKSKAATAMKSAEIMDVTSAEVTQVMTDNNVELMIHGHTHRPFVHDVTLANGRTGQRIVLGDWYSQSSYLTFDADSFELHHAPLSPEDKNSA
ncbi:UDP-2,3-diacylglucosamine diphosphatase [Corallincola holothuriorum]|uniref:UDP-2,3-diacylglucosamine hydrolase n=1 Tax=Corallincola holothuriorum TaxID=2282215 RepID=A0A368MZF4_9GAMM|nr:UDP-2,3-diacylglucosamine diphosphatase [Corallincola holothuriorum]RCU43647.1 UDP-2,3-diacylglucosamine diphosphatase [Corallincola holothuriorum]